jgi:phage gp29-like protein
MVAIVDQYGRPIQKSEIAEPQTARLAQLHHEFQGHPSRGLTPSRLAAILEGAERGDVIAQFELFEDMEEKDAHIHAEMGKRRRAVVGLPWEIVPPANPSRAEKKAAVELRELLNQVDDFEDVLFDMTDGIGKGFCCQEIEWHRVDEVWLPKTITHRPQSWFVLKRGYRQEIRLRDYSPDGQSLTPFGWLTHVHRAKSGYVERTALFRVLVWPYLFKNYSVADLAEFLEIYGIPLRLGKYPPSASEAEKTTLLRALVNLGHNAAGIIPEGMSLEFEEAATGDPKAFELMMDWCERSESKAILGATLTSQADRGSNTNALGNVHNEVRKDLRDADARQIQTTLTRDLIYPIAALNGFLTDGPRRAPRLVFNTREPEDLKLYADALPALVKIGMRIPRRWASEQLAIPEPAEGDDVLEERETAAAAPPAPGDKPKAIAAAKAKRPSTEDAVQDYADAVVAALADRAAPDLVGWVDRARAVVENAQSYEAMVVGLAALETGLPVESLGQLLQEAFTAAERGGRVSVLEDADDA